MLGTYYYNEIFRKTVVAFGTIFNNLDIRHQDSSGNVTSIIKVPLSYAPIQKFLARIEQQADIESKKGITLPRMSFEMTSLTYDPSRKGTATKQFKAYNKSNKKEVKKVFMPVPYNMGFELNIMTKLNEDALQIIEQILPYFQPAYNVSVKLIDEINEIKDIPVVLESIRMRDDYDGDFNKRRVLLYTLQFNVKTYLYGPIPSGSTPGVIKKVQVDYHTDTAKKTPRSVRYIGTPTSTKNYIGTQITTLSESIESDTTLISVADASELTSQSRITINDELIYINSINGNNLTVTRGYENTTKVGHIASTAIFLVDSHDDNLIEPEDDFGFSGSIEMFSDEKVYNPTSGSDIEP
tara:strand:- start:443 stop:1501 length:1059 start_codon:yes stop_codon:yes gene_type:complete